jgi:hypothetical protein
LRMGCCSPGNRVDRMTVASEGERHEHRNGPVGRYCLFHFQTPSQVPWADGPTSGHFDFKGLSLSHKDAAAQSIVAVLSTAYDALALCLLVMSDSCHFHSVTAEIKLYKLLATFAPRNCQIR